MVRFTSKDEIERARNTLFDTFATGRTKSLAWRKWQLKQCYWMIEDNKARLVEALSKDLNRHLLETMLADIASTEADILENITHLYKWTADTKPKAGFLFGTMCKSRIRKEPLGVTLIIGAWNFPILLLISPLVAAIAAGIVAVCCSNRQLAPHVEAVLLDIVPKYLDPQAIRIVTGGPSEMEVILALQYNHIFFTGSSKVARHITAAAAKHLTPVVLELGGQGPCIVAKSADIDLAAKRITYAKFNNSGQICLSVNHVYVEPEIAQQLVKRMAYWNDRYLAEGTKCMTRIVNERNFDRLMRLLENSKGDIIYGGKHDRRQKFIHPTIVTNIQSSDSLLSEELFGPICPVISCPVSEAIAHIGSLPNPLALYIFSRDEEVTEKIISSTLSGGVTVNNVFVHAAVPDAPFGGVGESGYGAYHGRHGIDCFSHNRTITTPPSWLDKLMLFTYPPYTTAKAAQATPKHKIGFKRGETLNDQNKPGIGPNQVLLTLGAILIGGMITVASLFSRGRASDLTGPKF